MSDDRQDLSVPGTDQRAPVRRPSVVLDVVVRAGFHLLLVVSVYLLFAGHNQPGGGFVGGLVAGAACATRYMAGGPAELRRSVRFEPLTVLGVGLAVAVLTGLVLLLGDGSFLDHRLLEADVALLGTVKTTTALFFDIGVYLVVIGMLLAVLEALGAPSQEEEA